MPTPPSALWRRWTGRPAAATTSCRSFSMRSEPAPLSARSATLSAVYSVFTRRPSSSERGGGIGPIRDSPSGVRRGIGGVLAIALLAATLALPFPTAAGVADQVGATFGLMIQDVVAAFPA